MLEKIRAAITAAHEEMADALRRLSDFHTSGDLDSAKAVAGQAGAVHAKLVRLHNESDEAADENGSQMYDADRDTRAPAAEGPGNVVG